MCLRGLLILISRDDLFIDTRARPLAALLRPVINLIESKPGPKAVRPFKVVDKRPIKITFDRDAACARANCFFGMAADELGALRVARVRDAVFRDIERFSDLRALAQKISQSFGIYLPSRIRAPIGILSPERDALIIIDSDKIQRIENRT